VTLAPDRAGPDTGPPVPRQYRGVPAPRETQARPGGPDRPKQAEGVELCGEYEGSGFKEPHYLVRRGDGQTLQITHLLHLVAEASDGQRDYAAIAGQVSDAYGRRVSADNVRVLVEKLRALGVLAGSDGSQPDVTPADPLLALRFKTKVVPKSAVRAVTALFYPLFLPPVVLGVLGAFLALDFWLFFTHGVGQSLREAMYNPATFLLVFALIVVSAAFHEVGHATACRYGGAEPGVMGAGVYVAWPAFYTDVTDAYRLGKAGRLRTDLGGVYFNIVFALGVFGVYFATGYEPLLLLVVVQQLEIVHQLLPLLRLDGYYIISDLTGVPDLFSRLGPILRSAVPGRKADRKVRELKPWVRVAVTAWVLIVVPVLAINLVFVLLSVPKIVGTASDSLGQQGSTMSDALGSGDLFAAGVGGVQALLLILPLLGMALTFGRLGKRITVSSWTSTRGRPVRRSAFMGGWLLLIAGLAYSWWPSPDYRPIREDERGTFTESVAVVRQLPAQRPSEPTGDPVRRDSDDGSSDLTGRDGVDSGTADPGGSGTTDGTSDSQPSPDPVATTDPSAEPTPVTSSSSSEPTASSSPSAVEASPSVSPAPVAGADGSAAPVGGGS
jgi:putative peptide zinc metalloprotease protein